MTIGPIGKIRVLTPTVRRSRFTRVGEIPANIRPTGLSPLRYGEVTERSGIITARRGLRYTYDLYEELERRAVPIAEVYGSVQERVLYKKLRGMNIPFDFQSSLLGARPGGTALGGLTADFVLLDRPTVIQVQGRIWHEGKEAEMRDILQADVLNQRGWDVVFLWDWVIEKESEFDRWIRSNVQYYMPRGLATDMGIRNFGGIRVEKYR